VARLAAGYIRIVHRTGRWEILGAAARDAGRSGRGRIILAIWHGRLFMVPTEMHPGLDVRAMISRNRDGEIIARTVARFGIATIRGSTHDPLKPDRDRGGREAFQEGLGALRDCENVLVALTPDGPRGPRMRCHHGVATLSAVSGVAVLPWTFSARGAWQLGSWDRFLIPRPFTRGVIAVGDPILPPQDSAPASIEAHRLRIEAALNELTRRADARVGRVTPAPGEPR
jgi:hypothetical protein